MRRKSTIFLIIFTLLIGSTALSFAGSQITKEYDFKAKSERNLKYDVPKEIKEKGKTYELKDVKYESEKGIEIIRSHTTLDQADYPKTIEYEKEDGEIVTLTAKGEIDWNEVDRNPTVITRTYQDRGSIPASLPVSTTVNGEEVTGTAALSGTQVFTRTESFNAPGTFYGVYGSPLYTYGGKTVTLPDGNPAWNGYQADVASNLGLPRGASINGVAWASAAVDQGNGEFIRQATFTGTRPVSTYTATFTETEATTRSYTADITYTDTADGSVQAKAIATYEQVSNLGLYIAIGAGILVLALLAAAILVFLAKKRKRQESN
jgi:hypothetical protein